MIQFDHVFKTYISGRKSIEALHDITFQVHRGDIFGVIGQSGAGKSSLIRCVNRLEQPTSGHILVEGIDITDLPLPELRQVRRRIGMIFQQAHLFSAQTVFDNVALPLRLMQMPEKILQKKVYDLLALVGLSHKACSYPAQLSGGQQQRVGIARALGPEPSLLLCDEATSALDPEMTQAVLDVLLQVQQALRITIFLITHEMDVIKAICNRVAIMEHGRLIETASTSDMLTAPTSVLGQAFVNRVLKWNIPAIVGEQIHQDIRSGSRPIIRIVFRGKTATEPVIAHLMQKYGLVLNILQAQIEHIQGDVFGIMLLEILCDPNTLAEAIRYMETLDIQVDVLGYVTHTHD